MECDVCHTVYHGKSGGWYTRHIQKCKKISEVNQMKNSLPNCYIFIENFQTPEEKDFKPVGQFLTTIKHTLDAQETGESIYDGEEEAEILIKPPKYGVENNIKQIRDLFPSNLQAKINSNGLDFETSPIWR